MRIQFPATGALIGTARDSLDKTATMSSVALSDRCLVPAPEIPDGGTTAVYPTRPTLPTTVICDPAPTMLPEGGGQPPAVWQTDGGWAVHLEIAGVSSGTRVAVGAKVDFGTVAAVWPPCESGCYEDVIPRDPSSWATLETRAAMCSNTVTISGTQVGAVTGSAAPDAGICNPPGGYGRDLDRTGPNQLVACPDDPAQGPYTIRARFRIANWGSVAGPASWNELATAENVTGTRLLSAPWDPTVDGGVTVTATTHQCMMVELERGSAASDLHFAPGAVFRNMMFHPASLIEKTAQIGLKAEDVRRFTDVPDARLFLYLQKKNMPEAGSAPMSLPLAEMDMRRSDVESGLLPRIPTEHLGSPLNKDTKGVFRLTSLEASLENLWPTFRVHPFLYVGRQTIVGDHKRDLVFPLTPFGLYIRHEGVFSGFRTLVKVDGQELTKSGQLVATNIRRVADNPIIELPIQIETLNDKPGGEPPDADSPDRPITMVGLPEPQDTPSKQPVICRCNVGGQAANPGMVLLVVSLAVVSAALKRSRRSRR
jgi:hypothetical protein